MAPVLIPDSQQHAQQSAAGDASTPEDGGDTHINIDNWSQVIPAMADWLVERAGHRRLAVATPVLIVYAAVVLWLARRRGLTTTTTLPAPDPEAVIPRAQQPLPATCPTGAPQKVFEVSAIDADIRYNRYGDHDPYGLAYVLREDVAAVRAGEKELEPLVMRVNEGDCVIVRLTNEVDWEHFEQHGMRGTLDGDSNPRLEAYRERAPFPVSAETIDTGVRVARHLLGAPAE